MKKNLLKRLFASIFVLLGVTIISFMLLRLGGGDPASLYAGALATPEEIEEVRVRMGLDRPLIIQYFDYLLGLLKGDLGYSWAFSMPVSELLATRIPQTLMLAVAGFGWACVFSIILGIIAGINQGSAIDFGAMFFAIIGQSMAPVWLGFMLILVFSVNLGWLPSQGIGGIVGTGFDLISDCTATADITVTGDDGACAGLIAGGMAPKVRGCIHAIRAGVGQVSILDGRVEHALLLEMLGQRVQGTTITG